MCAFSNRPLRWLAVLGVLAGSFGLPLNGANPARAAEQLANLKKIDRELESLIAAKSKKKHHHKKHHHKKKAAASSSPSSSTTPVAKKKHHNKKHHNKKKKKTTSVRQLEQQLDNILNRDLGKKS